MVASSGDQAADVASGTSAGSTQPARKPRTSRPPPSPAFLARLERFEAEARQDAAGRPAQALMVPAHAQRFRRVSLPASSDASASNDGAQRATDRSRQATRGVSAQVRRETAPQTSTPKPNVAAGPATRGRLGDMDWRPRDRRIDGLPENSDHASLFGPDNALSPRVAPDRNEAPVRAPSLEQNKVTPSRPVASSGKQAHIVPTSRRVRRHSDAPLQPAAGGDKANHLAFLHPTSPELAQPSARAVHARPVPALQNIALELPISGPFSRLASPSTSPHQCPIPSPARTEKRPRSGQTRLDMPSRQRTRDESSSRDHRPSQPNQRDQFPHPNDPLSRPSESTGGPGRSSTPSRDTRAPPRDADGIVKPKPKSSLRLDHGGRPEFEDCPCQSPDASKPTTPTSSKSPAAGLSPIQSPDGCRVAQPAAKVFAFDAPPLHLPVLDAFLADPVRFSAPSFTEADAIATDEERELYGYDRRRGKLGRGDLLEVAGAQLLVPSRAAEPNTGVRRRTVMPNNPVDEDQKLLRQENGASPPSPADGDADLSLTPSTGIVSDTVSLGISSSLSSASKPQTRLEMFPPLMLLKESSLDELKSNAVGPRKPPGGFLAKLPPMGSMISTVVDFIIGMEGSAFAAGIFRLELLRDFAQIMALQLHFDVSPSTGGAEKWSARWIILHFIPSILALDFVSILGKALILLLIWIIVVAALLIKFWRMTRAPNPNRTIEGFVSQPWLFTSPSMGTKLVNILTVFILTTLYIPLSKLAVDTISWSSDFWPVPNPYANGDNVGDLAPLGPASRFRDPMDFCWTTTMAKDEFNFAWLAVPIAVLTVIIYTLWYPYAMAKTIRPLLPRVSDFNELGVPRSEDEKEVEYLRLLERDRSPLNFMYKAYRRRWGFYKPLYILCFKLSNILVIGIVTKDNCLFRSMPGRTMLVVQQSTLIVLWSVLFAIHLYVVPFNDRISNRSELVSRAGYVLTAVVGLLVALQVQGSTVYRSTILYLIQALTYAGNIYFSLAGTGWMEHLVKRAQSRIDFSIDIFSPALDLDKHVKRRIWQETLSTLLLCARPYHMRPGKVVAFSIADDWPPYMLWFEGSPAERHVENLKILKAIGSDTYREQVDLLRNGENAARLTAVMDAIQSRLAGPDAYWRPTQPPFPVGVSSWFGKAFLVPFPPTLVMRYDQVQGDETVQLSTLGELELFVSQNEDPEVLSRRWVRTALRALDGQLVQAPHTEVVQIGGRLASSESFLQRRRSRVRAALGLGPRQGSGEFTLACPTSYETGTLRIARRELGWQGGPHDFASGFEVTVTYAEGTRQDPEGLTRVRKALTVDGTTAFGLHDDFRLTSDLVRFLRANEHIVHARRDNVERNLQQYRDGYATEAIRKRETLDYAFLTDVFDAPTLDRVQLRQTLRMVTRNPSVQHLPRQYRAAMTLLHERLMHVNQSPVHKWWWLFWDDLWRQNGRDYSQLRRHRRALCPHYPSSIAYQPVPRAELERFLDQRGLWQCQGARGVINRGLLNRLYFYLNMIVFARTRSWIKTHTMKDQSNPFADPPLLPANATSGRIARHHSDAAVRVALGTIRAYGRVEVEEHDINTIDSSLDPMSRFTGGGTNHDGSNIIERPAWPWAEQRLGGRPLLTRSERIWDRVMEWLALQPYKVNAHLRTLYLYLDLVDGPKGSRYELPGTHQESAFAEQVAEESPRTYPKIEQTAEEIALDRLSRPI